MLRDRQHIWRRLNLLGDIILTYVALLAVILLYDPELGAYETGLLFAVVSVAWTIFLYGPSGSYFYRMKPVGQVIKELYWGLFKSFAAFIVALFFIAMDIPARAILVFFALNAVLLTMSRLVLAAALNLYRAQGRSNRNVLIIGSAERAKLVADRVCDNPQWGIHILGFLDYHRTGLWRYRDIPLIAHPDSLPEIVKTNQVDYLVIAVEDGDLPLTSHAFAVAEEMGVTVSLLSDPYFHPVSKARAATFMDFPAVVYSSLPNDRMQIAFKKAIDWIGAMVGLIVSSPVMLITALIIKLEDGGPVLFRQTRSGHNGRPFTMLKFRTMIPDADKLKDTLAEQNEMDGPVFKIRNDPRVTRVGALLRKTSIDELPQLINVIRGDMSLVGPRPPLPNEVSQYDRWQRRKLSVKPGLTCLWQVNGRNKIDFENWMKLDLEYIDNWSLWLDTKILMRTIPAVFRRDGAS
jgi:exopolysaccharide biosynthesis polyprenyl glycosylphosphotransferase